MQNRSIALFPVAFVVALVLQGCLMGPCGCSFEAPHMQSRADIDFAYAGAKPDMYKARLVAKAHILAQQRDPSAVRIGWPSEFHRELDLPHDDGQGPTPASWKLTVTVTAPDADTGAVRESKCVFSYRREALVQVVERSGDRSYDPPVPIDELVAQALEQGYALDPGEMPAADEP
jgi:hypothetical protein